jgi:hypothetical protein
MLLRLLSTDSLDGYNESVTDDGGDILEGETVAVTDGVEDGSGGSLLCGETENDGGVLDVHARPKGRSAVDVGRDAVLASKVDDGLREAVWSPSP